MVQLLKMTNYYSLLNLEIEFDYEKTAFMLLKTTLSHSIQIIIIFILPIIQNEYNKQEN